MRIVAEFLKKNSQVLFAAFTMAVTLTVFYPIGVYQNNANVISFSLQSVAGLLLSVALLVFVILAGLAIFIKIFYEHIGVIYASIVVAFWVQGNLLAYELGNLDGHIIDWREFDNFYLIEFLLWAGVILASVWFRKILQKNLNTLLTILILFECIPLAITGFQQSLNQKAGPGLYFSDEHKFEFSSDQNVVVIVLDTIRTDAFEQILERTPSYRSTFKDFTFFTNTVAGYRTTKPSIPLILSGEYYDNSIPFREYLANTQDRSLPAILKAQGYTVEQYSFVPIAYPLIWDNASNTPSKDELFTSTEKLYLVTFLRYLPLPFKPFLVDRYYEGRESWGSDMVDLYNNASRVSKVDKAPVFKFIHLTGAHSPLQLDSSLQFTSEGSYLDQFEGGLLAIDKLLQEMKVADVYNNSLIFITGDHGSTYPWDVQNELRKSATTLMLNGMAPLLVKGFHEEHNELRTSSAPVSLMDIPKSVIDALGLDNPLPGVSVFGNIPDDRTRIFYFYEWYDADWASDFIPPLLKFEVTGDVRNRQSWHFSGEELVGEGKINLWPLHYQYGENIVSDANLHRELYSIGFDGNEAEGLWATAPYSCLHLPVESRKAYYSLSFSVSPYLDAKYIPQQTLNIVVNDSIVESFQLQKKETFSTTVLLPASLLDENELNLCFEFPDAKYSLRELGLQNTARYLGGYFRSIIINGTDGYGLPAEFDFSMNGNGHTINASGWSTPEPEHTWTVGENAQLLVPLAVENAQDLKLTVSANPFIYGEKLSQQVIVVRVGGDELTRWIMDRPGEYVVNIPSKYITDGFVRIDFEIPNATSPMSIDFNQDGRVLGMAVRWIRIEEQ